MTKVKLENIGTRYYVHLKGHAGYAPNGSDIVCAGISTLANAFILHCEEAQEKRECIVNTCRLNSDDGEIEYIVDGNVKDAFNMLKLGIEALASDYPEYVSI